MHSILYHADIPKTCLVNSAGGAIFSGQLHAQLNALSPSLPPDILRLVLADVKAVFSLPDNIKNPVTHAYINAIDHLFIAGIASASLAGFVALLLIKRGKISLQKTV